MLNPLTFKLIGNMLLFAFLIVEDGLITRADSRMPIDLVNSVNEFF